jgi:hypothetical protein
MNMYIRCPICHQKFDAHNRAQVCNDPDCKEKFKSKAMMKYRKAKKNIVDVLLRNECFFSYLNCCSEGEQNNGLLTINRKDGRSIDFLLKDRSITNMTKNEIAYIIGKQEDYFVMCRRHQTILLFYIHDHPSEEPVARYENALLHVIDSETEKSPDERDEH